MIDREKEYRISGDLVTGVLTALSVAHFPETPFGHVVQIVNMLNALEEYSPEAGVEAVQEQFDAANNGQEVEVS